MIGLFSNRSTRKRNAPDGSTYSKSSSAHAAEQHRPTAPNIQPQTSNRRSHIIRRPFHQQQTERCAARDNACPAHHATRRTRGRDVHHANMNTRRAGDDSCPTRVFARVLMKAAYQKGHRARKPVCGFLHLFALINPARAKKTVKTKRCMPPAGHATPRVSCDAREDAWCPECFSPSSQRAP